MTCRHRPGDPDCTSNGGGRFYASTSTPTTPDSERYYIRDARRVGHHLVLRAQYPNCSNCAYEGHKVMVFLNVTEMEALRWRRIDPHFRDPKSAKHDDSAPSPAARFPASSEGWDDAIAYATSKGGR